MKTRMKTPIISTTSKIQRFLEVIALVSAALLAFPALTAKAADIHWQGPTASYTNIADWVGGVVPGFADNAINDNGSNNAVQINAGNPDWTVNQIRAGNGAGNGAFEQNAQTLTLSNISRAFRLGVAAADTGVYTLNGGVINYNSGAFNVGEIGTGILNMNGGSIVGSGNFAANFGLSTPNVSASMDGGTSLTGTTWFEQGFDGANPAVGLPVPGSTIISNVLGADHSYTFAPSYNANDTVMIGSNEVTSATITLTSPTACSALSFLGSAGNGQM
ncbi:MAG: hypothetical protein QOJ40_970, partial [Verrucomicrobiota bacterium]